MWLDSTLGELTVGCLWVGMGDMSWEAGVILGWLQWFATVLKAEKSCLRVIVDTIWMNISSWSSILLSPYP